MNKKVALSIILALMMGTANLYAQNTDAALTRVILSAWSARTFSSGSISAQELDLILKCGLKAPSARNGQPWKFTVLKDSALISGFIDNIRSGNVVIIVSGPDSEQAGNIDFDCALATENMYLAAQSLGLSSRIYTGPMKSINSLKQTFGVPDAYRAVSVLRIGHVDKGVDAVSSASTRKNLEEVVIYK